MLQKKTFFAYVRVLLFKLWVKPFKSLLIVISFPKEVVIILNALSFLFLQRFNGALEWVMELPSGPTVLLALTWLT